MDLIFDGNIHFRDEYIGYIGKIYEIDSEDSHKMSQKDISEFLNKFFACIDKDKFEKQIIYRPQWITEHIKQKAYLILKFIRKDTPTGQQLIII